MHLLISLFDKSKRKIINGNESKYLRMCRDAERLMVDIRCVKTENSRCCSVQNRNIPHKQKNGFSKEK